MLIQPLSLLNANLLASKTKEQILRDTRKYLLADNIKIFPLGRGSHLSLLELTHILDNGLASFSIEPSP